VGDMIKSFAAFLLVSAVAAAAAADEPIRAPAQLYATFCAACHGQDHRGGQASSLADGAWAYGHTDEQVFRNTMHGIPTLGMPAFEDALSEAEVHGLVAYLRELEARQTVAPPPPPPAGDVVETELHTYRIETVAEGLDVPWGLAWLPDGRALLTERPGRLRMLVDGQLHPDPIRDTPAVLSFGQGGLMDVALDPDFANNGWVYLAYSHGLAGERRQAMTRIVRGRVVDHAWTDQQVLWQAEAEHYSRAGVHFGSRIAFDGKGHLFFSIGDRGAQNQAQELNRPNGKVHRIRTDGSIPSDNPFVDHPGAVKSIYSYGNRNPQGLVFVHDTGKLWSTEHGPRGGDELNLIEAGLNYGWPVITYGINYNGTPITDLTEKPGMEQPVIDWTPSIAVCGLDVYRGDAFPEWRGDLLVGALAYQEVRRVRLDGRRAAEQEVILKGRGRVRDVTVGPDGFIYVALNSPDKLIRLVPEMSR
jgi:glucose/arabinose dehydrogenase